MYHVCPHPHSHSRPRRAHVTAARDLTTVPGPSPRGNARPLPNEKDTLCGREAWPARDFCSAWLQLCGPQEKWHRKPSFFNAPLNDERGSTRRQTTSQQPDLTSADRPAPQPRCKPGQNRARGAQGTQRGQPKNQSCIDEESTAASAPFSRFFLSPNLLRTLYTRTLALNQDAVCWSEIASSLDSPTLHRRCILFRRPLARAR